MRDSSRRAERIRLPPSRFLVARHAWVIALVSRCPHPKPSALHFIAVQRLQRHETCNDKGPSCCPKNASLSTGLPGPASIRASSGPGPPHPRADDSPPPPPVVAQGRCRLGSPRNTRGRARPCRRSSTFTNRKATAGGTTSTTGPTGKPRMTLWTTAKTCTSAWPGARPGCPKGRGCALTM